MRDSRRFFSHGESVEHCGTQRGRLSLPARPDGHSPTHATAAAPPPPRPRTRHRLPAPVFSHRACALPIMRRRPSVTHPSLGGAVGGQLLASPRPSVRPAPEAFPGDGRPGNIRAGGGHRPLWLRGPAMEHIRTTKVSCFGLPLPGGAASRGAAALPVLRRELRGVEGLFGSAVPAPLLSAEGRGDVVLLFLLPFCSWCLQLGVATGARGAGDGAVWLGRFPAQAVPGGQGRPGALLG